MASYLEQFISCSFEFLYLLVRQKKASDSVKVSKLDSNLERWNSSTQSKGIFVRKSESGGFVCDPSLKLNFLV